MIDILIIAGLSLLAQLVLPWWSLALVAFGVCYWRSRTGGQAFSRAFLGVALVWLVYALFVHIRTDGVLTGRMAELVLKTTSPVGMLALAPVLAGLVGGLAGLAGQQVRRAVLG